MKYKEMLLKKIADFSSAINNDFAETRATLYVVNEVLLDVMLNGGYTSDVQEILDELEESLTN